MYSELIDFFLYNEENLKINALTKTLVTVVPKPTKIYTKSSFNLEFKNTSQTYLTLSGLFCIIFKRPICAQIHSFLNLT